MNIVIIEDEPIIANNLESILIELEPSFNVLKSLTSVKSSIDWLKKNQLICDLLIMDIHLTDGLSFEIFNKVECNTPIIFITAYDQYALKAFKVNGIDYILKPFDKEKIKKSLKKFKSLSQLGTNLKKFENLKDLIKIVSSNTVTNYKKSYLAHHQDKITPIPVENISWFHKSNQISYACTADNKRFVIMDSLDKIQKEVSSINFFRANRQFIVRKNAIKNITLYFNGRFIVNISPDPKEKIIISKAKARNFKNWLVK